MPILSFASVRCPMFPIAPPGVFATTAFPCASVSPEIVAVPVIKKI